MIQAYSLTYYDGSGPGLAEVSLTPMVTPSVRARPETMDSFFAVPGSSTSSALVKFTVEETNHEAIILAFI